jgi:3-dehydroquinate synthase class II
MNIELKPEANSYIEKLIAEKTIWETPEQVIEAALQVLHNQICPTHHKVEELNKLIQDGIDAIDRGDFVSSAEIYDSIRAKYSTSDATIKTVKDKIENFDDVSYHISAMAPVSAQLARRVDTFDTGWEDADNLLYISLTSSKLAEKFREIADFYDSGVIQLAKAKLPPLEKTQVKTEETLLPDVQTT